MTYHSRITAASSVPRRMSITDALHWAFAVEKAQLDFDATGAHEFARSAVDTVWVIAQQGALGCRIDGGAAGAVGSDTATDAAIIAAAVEQMPENHGGRRMALLIAEHARAGVAPDWGKHDRPKCVSSWDCADGGWEAYTEKVLWRWKGARGANRSGYAHFCPVSWTGTAAQIAAKRRTYLAWFGALLHLHSVLEGALYDVVLTGAMPDMTPWRAGE